VLFVSLSVNTLT